jgi:cytochrome P450
MGGKDTTMNLVQMAHYCLATLPDVLDKLEKEIFSRKKRNLY